MKRSLPDVNVWFALAVEEHQHHIQARAWWEEGAGWCGFVPLTMLGFLRLLTSASPMRGKPLTNDAAWAVVDSLLDDERVGLLPELSPLDSRFRGLSQGLQASPKVWADAYLAAHAAANEVTIITFDRAFTRYGVKCRILA